jgi:hypothetical protein
MQRRMKLGARAQRWGAVTALVLLSLAGCGGGGGESDPALEVTVKVDGVADTAGPLNAGESASISVPSGATLAFDSTGETRWAPTATDSTFKVQSFSYTAKSMTVSSTSGGSLVVVFTDKADESKQATLNVTVAPKEFQKVPRTDGEVGGWAESWTNAAGVSTQSDTFDRTVLMDGGGYGVEHAEAPGAFSTTRTLYDDQDRYLGSAGTQVGSECIYDSPVAIVSYPLHVGKAWSGDASRTCGSKVSQHYSRSVEGYERVVVPQGTHDALRIKSEAVYTVTLSNPGNARTYSYTLKSTCWWAVDLGRNVKCNHAYAYDDGTSEIGSQVMTSLTR